MLKDTHMTWKLTSLRQVKTERKNACLPSSAGAYAFVMYGCWDTSRRIEILATRCRGSLISETAGYWKHKQVRFSATFSVIKNASSPTLKLVISESADERSAIVLACAAFS